LHWKQGHKAGCMSAKKAQVAAWEATQKVIEENVRTLQAKHLALESEQSCPSSPSCCSYAGTPPSTPPPSSPTPVPFGTNWEEFRKEPQFNLYNQLEAEYASNRAASHPSTSMREDQTPMAPASPVSPSELTGSPLFYSPPSPTYSSLCGSESNATSPRAPVTSMREDQPPQAPALLVSSPVPGELETKVIALAATLAGLRGLLTGSRLCPQLPAAHWQPRNPTAAQDGQPGNPTAAEAAEAAEEQKLRRNAKFFPQQALCDQVADLDLQVGYLQSQAAWLMGKVTGLDDDVAELTRMVDQQLLDHR
jgi:hypothetical protein